MFKHKKGFFKKALSAVLSATCMLSGLALAGTMAMSSPVEASAVTNTSSKAFSWDNVTMYFLLTDRFKNGDTSNDHAYGRGMNNGSVVNYDTTGSFKGGDFKGITQAINDGYFDDLGVNAIWLSAPYEQIHGYCVAGDGDSFAHYSYHGYYVLDYTEPDLNFGTKADFKEMVDTAHSHGIRIVMDVVMNHSGYNTLQDMYEFKFGELKSGWDTYYYAHQNINNTTYHGYVNYEASANPSWSDWWGTNWIRCGLPNYNTQGQGPSEQIECLAGLPDFRTESGALVGIPKFLQTKWEKEGTLSAKQAKYGNDTVTGHISTWLAEWVEEFGVDGFRCDTAKHVGKTEWGQLKTKCVAALKKWRQNNPTAVGADWTDDFWMTGEHFGHGVGKDDYYTTGGFDSMINFEFAPTVGQSNVPGADSVETVYSRYASSINSDPSFNVLTYLASHDTTLIKGDRNHAGSFLLMLPGGIQIYYGDETNRPLDSSAKANADPGAGHQLRTFMNWDSIDQGVLKHWQKLGQFRNNHLAVGAGSHKLISAYSSSSGYTFARTYNDDKVVVTLFAPANTEITVDVSGIFSDGIEVTNFYDDTTAKVSGGKVTFNSGANGTILIQEPDGEKGKVTVTHIDQDSGKTIKTETMAGLVGTSYTISPLSQEGFKLARTVGQTTGTYSGTPAEVTFYYTFDDVNYAYIVVKHVDAATGTELADSTTEVAKVGTTYSASPVDIKNYEVDLTKSTNVSGTVAAGTTTATFKYNYVEPTNLRVHYYNANGWPSVNLYAYDESGATVKEFTGKWGGTAMQDEGNGWFYLEVPDTESAQVIFNCQGDDNRKEPAGASTPGYQASGEVYFKNGTAQAVSTVMVMYTSTNGTTLGSAKLTGMSGDSYTTTAKTFTGYKLKTTPDNATGTFGATTITVTYVYEPEGGQELVNNSSISATSINKGESVKLTGAASGGTTPYQYAYVAQIPAGDWKVIKDYSTSTSHTWTPASTGTYTVQVKVKDNAGTVKVKSFTLKVNGSALTNNSTISATTIGKGTAVKMTGAASGGTTPYKYAYVVQAPSGDWTVLKDYSTATSHTWTPASTGKYTVQIKVKDASSKVVVKSYTLTVNNALVNNSKISATSITKGTTLKLTGAASGGTTPYKFAYVAKTPAGEWKVIKDYSTSTSHSWTPASVGTYTVQIKVKDAKNTVVVKSFTLKVATALVNNSKISATSIEKGTAVKMTGAASGGTTPYKFAYVVQAPNGNWTVLKDYSTATTHTWTPASTGKYTVQIKVKDAKNTVVVKSFTLTVSAALVNNSKISATTIVKGSSVKLTASASGGSGFYNYAYVAKTPAGEWKVLKNYSTATSHTWTPASTGKYTVQVKVRDSNSLVKIKEFTLTVNTALVNNSKISSTSITKGTTIKLTGAASGGVTPYQYAYVAKTPAGEWKVIKNYSTSTTHSWTPASVGTYTVQIKVKDAKGTIVVKSFTLKVAAGLTNTSKISATNITKGKSVTMTGSATGGTNFYQYAYVVQSPSGNWTVLKDYSSATTHTWTPASYGTYTVQVKVKDTSGSTAVKSFSLKVS